jgi:hypothetical protein
MKRSALLVLMGCEPSKEIFQIRCPVYCRPKNSSVIREVQIGELNFLLNENIHLALASGKPYPSSAEEFAPLKRDFKMILQLDEEIMKKYRAYCSISEEVQPTEIQNLEIVIGSVITYQDEERQGCIILS